MSDFGAKFASQGAKLGALLGDAGTYTPLAGQAIAVTKAVFQKLPDAGTGESHATLIIAAALLPGLSSANRRGDRWTNTGQSDAWTVTDYEDNLDGYLVLNLAMPRVIGS